ncbi:hypothetical protein GCM10009105_24570 [Dokdonella soli]|uniref:Uncharacterized protein n=1 Tax=Dokdonella soli TaxID=529810 RepID=A0ABN1IML1_9GAMM
MLGLDVRLTVAIEWTLDRSALELIIRVRPEFGEDHAGEGEPADPG